MKLEQQVCSLDLAKRLKELGVKQDSLFYWSEGTIPATLWWLPSLERNDDIYPDSPNYSAFTVAELGEMLPAYILNYEKMRFDLNVWKDAGWNVAYWWDEDTCHLSGMKIQSACEATEADARAKMLIYLLENKLVTLP